MVILKRSLVRLKWIALSLLTFGIALVVLPKDASAAAMAYLIGSNEDVSTLDQQSTVNINDVGNQSNAKGFFAVLMACVLSGLAGVYFEKILKAPPTKPMPEVVNTRMDEEAAESLVEGNKSTTASDDGVDGGNSGRGTAKRVVVVDHDDDDDDNDDNADGQGGIGLRDIHGRREDVMQTQQQNQLWVRNLQMSFFSILLGLIFVVLLQDGATIVQKGFFVNYNSLTWLVISIQAFGGLVVALVVKYADNILKGFATSISIILSSLVSVWFFNFTLSGTFILGTALVIYSTYLYGL